MVSVRPEEEGPPEAFFSARRNFVLRERDCDRAISERCACSDDELKDVPPSSHSPTRLRRRLFLQFGNAIQKCVRKSIFTLNRAKRAI
jgi:hypothetical protein